MKIINSLILIFSVLISLNLKAQTINDFYFEINSARNLVKIDKSDSAIIVYENAFNKVEYVNTKFLKEVKSLLKKKDVIKTKYYSDRIEKQLKGTNIDLKRFIDSLFIYDQKIRGSKHYNASQYYFKCNNDINCNKKSNKYLKAERLFTEWKNTDERNISLLLKTIEKHGYLGEEIIGNSTNKFHIMLLHFDSDTNNLTLSPILNIAFKEGSILPYEYATILDRHSFSQTNSQKYWMWPVSSKNEKLSFSNENIIPILKLRETIGVYDSDLWQVKKGKYWVLKNKYNR